MRSLYESIISSDEETQKQIQQELDKLNIKKALIEFLHYLHIDDLNDEEDFRETLSSHTNFVECRFNLKNYIDYITKNAHHGSEQWYLDLSYESVVYNCQYFIQNALKEFEKTLDKSHIRYKKTGRDNVKYELLDTEVRFIIYRVIEKGFKKSYDKKTKGSLEFRKSAKNWNWWFRFQVPKEIWNL